MTRPSSRRAFFKSSALAGVLAVPGLQRLTDITSKYCALGLLSEPNLLF